MGEFLPDDQETGATMKISRKKLIVGAAIVLGAAAVAIKIFSPTSAEYVSPQRRHLVQEVFGTGTVEARVLVSEGSKITGRVTKLYVDQGDVVKKGQLLAVLESDDLQALVKQASDTHKKSLSMEAAAKDDLARARAASEAADAALQKSEAAMKLAKQTLKRYAELFKRGIVARQDLDEKQDAYDEAMRQRDDLKAQKAAAKADMERVKNTLQAARHDTRAQAASSNYARAKLADSFVRASMDGVVVSRDVEEGDAVIPGTPVFHIADPDTVWVKSNIDEAQGGGIAMGNPSRIFLRTDRKHPVTGRVERIGEESDRVTEEMEVDVHFPLNNKRVLHLGEQADVYVKGREKDCLSVPSDCVTVRNGKEGVFVAKGDRAHFVPVKIGIWTHDYAETPGLGDNEKVILLDHGLEAKLKDGARIKPVPAPSGGGR